jgi:integrase/recombinase XerD
MTGRPRGSGGKAKELSAAEIKRIDKCLTGTRHEQRNRSLFYLGLGSGMRIAEMCALTIGVVAPYGELVSELVLEKHSTKSKRSRTVHLSPQAVAHLKRYLSCQWGDVLPPAETPLFPSQRRPSSALTANAGVLILTRMFDEASVPGASSHSLRRTHANALRRNGVDLKIIQEQLGHSSLAVTERYFEVDPLEKARAVNNLRF